MLENMRGSGQSKTMWVIIGLLMVGLVGFGSGGLSNLTLRDVGTVGEEPIEVATYARGAQTAVQRMNLTSGRALSPSELRQSGAFERVLDAVVGQAALTNEVTTKGLSVGDDRVRTAVVNNPQFQGASGFDREAYEFYLDRQLGVTPAEFERIIRKETTRGILEDAVVGGVEGDVSATVALINFSAQERDFEWLAITEAMLTDPVAAPTDAEIAAYYEDFATDYQTPRTRNITYAWLDPAALSEEIEISEEELRDAYEAQGARYNAPERRALDRLVFPSLQDAEAARARIDSAETTFAQEVVARGLAVADISLGEAERRDLGATAADAIFAAEGPGIVGPVESTLGPALFRVNAILAADSTPFEEAREELRDELAGEAARRQVADIASRLQDLTAGGATIENLAEDTPMVLGKVEFNPDADDPIVAYEAFRTAALAAQEDDFPDIFDLDDGGVFALRLDGIVEPAAIPLEDVRDRVIADLVELDRLRKLTARAEELKAELDAGADPEDLSPLAEDDAAAATDTQFPTSDTPIWTL
ncbi:MAG: SurA N-terminal domain-containing protein, partial [Pseudomonadota bacterium]